MPIAKKYVPKKSKAEELFEETQKAKLILEKFKNKKELTNNDKEDMNKAISSLMGTINKNELFGKEKSSNLKKITESFNAHKQIYNKYIDSDIVKNNYNNWNSKINKNMDDVKENDKIFKKIFNLDKEGKSLIDDICKDDIEHLKEECVKLSPESDTASETKSETKSDISHMSDKSLDSVKFECSMCGSHTDQNDAWDYEHEKICPHCYFWINYQKFNSENISDNDLNDMYAYVEKYRDSHDYKGCTRLNACILCGHKNTNKKQTPSPRSSPIEVANDDYSIFDTSIANYARIEISV